MTLRSLVSGFLACASILFISRSAHARCAPSAVYETSFQIVSCEDRDPGDRSKRLGYGVILEVNVLSKNRIGSPGDYDWWPAKDRLPAKMKVFHDTTRKESCASMKPGTKWKGAMRLLCCDGGEPRCNFGTSVGLYSLKK